MCILIEKKSFAACKAGDTRARNLHKLSSKFISLYIDEQYSSSMTSTNKNRNLFENLHNLLPVCHHFNKIIK